MATTVFPETGDAITEAAWTAHNQSLTIANRYRLNGYTVSAGSGLNANIAAGTCYVNGLTIVSDGVQAVAVAANNTNYIWLNEDGTLSANTTGTNPGSELLVGKAVTDGSGVTSVSHEFDIENAFNAYKRKSSDQIVNNSAALQNDNKLKFAVQDGEQWEITAMLLLKADSAVPDIKLAWDVSGGSISQFNYIWGPITLGGAVDADFSTTSVEFELGTGGPYPVIFKSLIFVTTGGTLNLQWAQVSADASDTTVKADSIITARRIAG